MSSHNVGIVTLPGSFNYGNRLQAYASVSIYRKLGFEPSLLEIEIRPNFVRDSKAFIKKLLRRKDENPETRMTEGRRASFSRFNSNMATQHCRDTVGLSSHFDCFSVGSDQTWNPYYCTYNDDWYFLAFARPEQRIALAPSIGLDALNSNQARRVARGVSGFSSLSTRERRGAELIKECSGRDAEVICDPTLTLSAEEWRTVADDRCTPTEPYVFTYLLGGIGVEAADVLDKLTNHGCIPVVPLSDRQKPGEPEAGPAEFISLIDHAAHVVTDSFHAAVFSSILQTPLTIVHREGGASMFSRLEQLSQMLGIEEKVYGSSNFDLSQAGDYEGVPVAIDRERKKLMDYLEGCLEEQVPGWREGARG